ncbi:MAG: DUF2264 domain-containing protein [Verrucomicrobia bacterium]|nr:DUF2264 domain-containing protein [Verrucomicrobiota bacterium]
MPFELWTERKHWEQLALDYWRNAIPHFRQTPGRWNLPYHPAHHSLRGGEMEGWSRQLWAMVPLLAGGTKVPDSELILDGIRCGVDPDSPHYWGKFSDCDQRMVECAVLGAGLRMCPEFFWHALSDRTRQQFAEFLNQINQFQTPDNNWLFFRVFVNCGLGHVGVDFPREVQEKSLDRIESFLLDEPWYSDGPGGKIDYYNPMGFHFYGLLYAIWQGNSDPERAQRFVHRAHLSAQAFIHWFDANGAAIPYGRSLTYRFAQGSLWSALAWAGGGPFSDGVLKGLLGRHMQWWQNLPIHGPDGTLTRGYGYPQDVMTEHYNSLGSPYWGFKLFWMLALPAEHPFWQATPEPLPASLQEPLPIPAARMIVTAPAHRQHVIAVCGGHDELRDFVRHAGAKYSKFAYSSQLAFAVPYAREPFSALAPDNTLLVRKSEDSHWYSRDRIKNFLSGDNWVQSDWIPFKGARITTRIEVKDGIQLRKHTISLDNECELIEGGFAVPSLPEPKAELTPGKIAIHSTPWCSWLQSMCGDGSLVQTELTPGSHLIFPRACLPIRKATLPAGEHYWETQAGADFIL